MAIYYVESNAKVIVEIQNCNCNFFKGNNILCNVYYL